ncbi:Holliday junction branch migration protein RuvA [Erysipelothrix tonsillarum]|uniref:Holliday junction branch migration protein RuvA n=1 Tax=Erysipelothrix tonsillarum TaxID=38402 RepID=UPI0003787D27|nr:Holliday junction branch migration protein RuvA [Erysipelothrix tonsillarum]
MIAFISGVAVDRGIDYVVVDNHGIGYQVFCGNPEMVTLNESIIFHTYQHVREDAIILFGFVEKRELDIFRQLITVKGVGPKTGITILSRFSGDDIVRAIDQEDMAFLKKLPGVGPKMASQMMLDLKGKFVATQTGVSKSAAIPQLEEALDALGDLGFKKAELNNIKNELAMLNLDSVDEFIKAGLKLLHSRKRGV